MPYRANYPATVAEILDDHMTFRPECLRALREFRRSKPWRGSYRERCLKFRSLNASLAQAYGLPTPKLTLPDQESNATGNGCYRLWRGRHWITLFDRLSVVTYLHEFAHARGYDERRAVRWSVNLFRRVFPRSYARCRHEHHMLIRRQS